ncbi:MAG: glycoside hydrolase family 19 protein [Pseudomonadota bacterium]|nr:glycoside hydrolase family 19 protein [Pseudomonadota bacterium]
MDRKRFYDVARQGIGALTQANVDGFERYLNEAWRRNTALDRLAYILATVFWETGRTMQPVREAFQLGSRAEAYRKRLRYYPWYGRGDIQLTWEGNYRKAGDAIGIDLIANPDAALEPQNAVKIAFEGMEQGWFTGKELEDYLDGVDEDDEEDLREFANARRVVNGTDKQIDIGKLALTFEAALRAAGYGEMHSTSPSTQPPTIGHNGSPPLNGAPPSRKPLVSKTDIARYSKLIGSLVGALVAWAGAQGLIQADVINADQIDQIALLLGGLIGTWAAPKNAE